MDPVECRDQRVNPACVACELRQVFDRVHHSTSRIGQRQHEPLVGDEVLHAVPFPAALANGIGHFCRAADSTPCREENGQRGQQVTVGAPTVLEDEILEDVVSNLEHVNTLHPALERLELAVEERLLHIGTAVEGDLLSVGNEPGMLASEVSLLAPFNCLELAERRR